MTGSVLVLVRHGESEWNKLNLFTGWKDPGLTELGRQEAHKGAKELKNRGYKFDVAFTSALSRAQTTLDIILKEIGQEDIPIFKDQALNERDYGDLTGLNKDDARKKWGEEQVHIWRRSYVRHSVLAKDVPPPGGESLELTGKRVMPYYEKEILPRVKKGENVLIAAHGNSLRSMIKELEGLSGEAIVKKELATGVPIVYTVDAEGNMTGVEILDSTTA
ncbi:phosphoglycerate mutase [Atractiella rhizophila]|nr:phosphoglycerate mutase [Atractiella rhizophila]